ncbi:type II secretion system F family protein [Angustibacter luteus]|uniref:Type II secretion system F family protein n=1 Tax=Angustibacter luteus TaxID=658456 RepID=A0ABW1JD08_9ACTN
MTATTTAILVGLAVLVWPARRRLHPATGGAAPDVTDGRVPQASVTAELLLSVVEMISAQVRAGSAPTSAWLSALDVLGLPSPGPSADPQVWWDRAARSKTAQSKTARSKTARSEAAQSARSAGAAWRLAERTGAPLADALDGVATTLREEQALSADIAAALAGPQATARLLTVLPLGGLVLGELIGARPLDVLVGTDLGRCCAVLGAVLLLLSRWWMRRLVRAVARAA